MTQRDQPTTSKIGEILNGKLGSIQGQNTGRSLEPSRKNSEAKSKVQPKVEKMVLPPILTDPEALEGYQREIQDSHILISN